MAASVALEEFYHALVYDVGQRLPVELELASPGSSMEDAHVRLKLALTRLDDQELAAKVDDWRARFFALLIPVRKIDQFPSNEIMSQYGAELTDLTRQLGTQARYVLSDENIQRLMS